MRRVSWWKFALGRVVCALSCVALGGCASSLAAEAERRGGDTVTQWSLIADYYGNGAANWRTLAIMQEAMHDALNAAHAVYARWSPAADGEPAADGATLEVAMAAAANEVLTLLHPEHAAETAAAFASIMARYPEDASKAAGNSLGRAIGREAVERRAHDGFDQVHFFQGNDGTGRWRPVPTLFATDAYFWAYQTSQRGFLNLAVRLLAAHRPPGGVYAEARIMAELTAALADSAILIWNAKLKYSYWRPITALRAQGDATWSPLVETPPFPEYPSGHASDCYVGAGVLEAAFPNLAGPVVYLSSAHMPPLRGDTVPLPPTTYGMGQHAQTVQTGQTEAPGGSELSFPSIAAAATNCANSRVWAGAHLAAANIESERLAGIIVRRALDATPPAERVSVQAR